MNVIRNFLQTSSQKQQAKGFTIVELLIVIVVIGILAAITIVAYNGIQQRAAVSRAVSDLTAINKAILLYYAENGSYPNTSLGWSGYRDGNTTNYVPGLVPKYLNALPVSPLVSTGGDYMYKSDGVNYKLLAHDVGGAGGTAYAKLCNAAVASNQALRDPSRICWAFGYSTPGAASF